MTRYQVNGQEKILDADRPGTLEDVVGALGLKADRIAVELNGGIIRKAEWAETAINDGDRLEIVHFVGGGSS